MPPVDTTAPTESTNAATAGAPSRNATKAPTVCVFCGASPGTSPEHLEAARKLARALHANGMNLVYGGGTVGIMGELAKTLVSLSGPDAVHGVIPAALVGFERSPDESQETNMTDETEKPNWVDEKTFGRITIVKDMHSRKQMMAKEVIEGGEGGGFVALSGGYGTLEELMEVVTWNQLGIHSKGVVVYNVDGYWDGLLQWVRKATSSGFIADANAGIIVEAKEAGEVVESLKGYQNSKGRFRLHWGQE